eukprot:m.93137 g.93137  ORF g.93137 m.93137 type:complete len:434 (-) comp8674_c2_seq2:271-1572(-)
MPSGHPSNPFLNTSVHRAMRGSCAAMGAGPVLCLWRLLGALSNLRTSLHSRTWAMAEDPRRLRLGRPQVSAGRRKVVRIQRCCDAGGERGELGRLAVEPLGLVNTAMRRHAWPLLLGIHLPSSEPPPSAQPPAQPDQVELDVNRSLWRFPTGIRSNRRIRLRESLSRILHSVLAANPHLHYYQGLHELCAVFMLVIDERASCILSERIANCHIRDFLEPSLSNVIAHLELLLPLLRHFDPELASFIADCGLEAHFALSWVLTWFAHVLDDFDDICRLFDVCLAGHPLTPLYLAAAMLHNQRERILATKHEYSAVYKVLLSVPPKANIESAVAVADDFRRQLPPSQLLRNTVVPEDARKLLDTSLSVANYKLLVNAIHEHGAQSAAKIQFPTTPPSAPMRLSARAMLPWAVGTVVGGLVSLAMASAAEFWLHHQ